MTSALRTSEIGIVRFGQGKWKATVMASRSTSTTRRAKATRTPIASRRNSAIRADGTGPRIATTARTGSAAIASSVQIHHSRNAAPRGRAASLTLPHRLALLNERLHALAEVTAHVAEQDEVCALFRQHAVPDAPQRLFRRLKREWRMRRDRPRELIDARHERVFVLGDLVVKADAQRLIGVDK